MEFLTIFAACLIGILLGAALLQVIVWAMWQDSWIADLLLFVIAAACMAGTIVLLGE